jgi:hypothetical protein
VINRILITGSRTWRDTATIRDAITNVAHQHGPDLVIVHGACRTGADRIAADFAYEIGYLTDPHPADWETCAPDCRPGHRRTRRDGSSYCPTAGHRRNQLMVDLGADHALVFMRGKSSGTADCLRRIKRAGIEYTRWDA